MSDIFSPEIKMSDETIKRLDEIKNSNQRLSGHEYSKMYKRDFENSPCSKTHRLVHLVWENDEKLIKNFPMYYFFPCPNEISINDDFWDVMEDETGEQLYMVTDTLKDGGLYQKVDGEIINLKEQNKNTMTGSRKVVN